LEKNKKFIFQEKENGKEKKLFQEFKNRKNLEKQKENKNSLCLIFFLSSFFFKIPFPSVLFFSFLFFDFLTFFFALLSNQNKKNKEKGIGIPSVMCITNLFVFVNLFFIKYSHSL